MSRLHIVTLGDSLAYGRGDEHREGIAARVKDALRLRGLAAAHTTNLGVNGAKTHELLPRLGQERVRKAVASAGAVVLSIGANDLRTRSLQERAMEEPLAVAGEILDRVANIVAEIRSINPRVRILILGGYNPAPRHFAAPLIEHYVGVWDAALAERFADDERIDIVAMHDVTRRPPQSLRRLPPRRGGVRGREREDCGDVGWVSCRLPAAGDEQQYCSR